MTSATGSYGTLRTCRRPRPPTTRARSATTDRANQTCATPHTGVFSAYRNPKLGAAILVGLAVITVLYLILEKAPTVFPMGNNPVPSLTVSTPMTNPSLGQTLPSGPVGTVEANEPGDLSR
ncbi:hypothetical protein ACWGKF_43435 [Streptomyces chartreusis]